MLVSGDTNPTAVVTYVRSAEIYTLLCLVCGEEFEPTNARQKFCGAICRHKKYRDDSQAYKALTTKQGARLRFASEGPAPPELVQVRHCIPITQEDADFSRRFSERFYGSPAADLPARSCLSPASTKRKDGR
jgi:hypothetical protein